MVSTIAYSETRFYLFGRGNYVNSAGAEADYREGENDFPIMSSHQTYGAGFGLTFGSTAFIGIEGHYNLSGKATLTDPSDDDTVEIDTYKYASALLTIGFNIIRKQSVRFYVSGGGGVSYTLDAKTKTYTSQLGYETRIETPEKKYPLTGFGGFGFEFFFSQSAGIILSGRYIYIDLDEPQTVFVGLAGIVFRL